MPSTEIYQNAGREVTGYMVNATFSQPSRVVIAQIQNKIAEDFPDLLLSLPADSLHITLLDWLDPLYEYIEPVEDLYAGYYESYNAAVEQTLRGKLPIKVHFREIRVSPQAVFLVGADDGSFANIRDSFLDQVELLPSMKQPPKIIHTSIARFKQVVDLERVEKATQGIRIDFDELVESFRLVEEQRIPMAQYKLIKEYRG